MTEKQKVTLETPKDTPMPKEVAETPQTSPDDQAVSVRSEIEKSVIEENAKLPEPEVEEPSETEEKKSEETPKETPRSETETKEDPVDRIKKSVQKRIDKEVAKRKTLEEQLAEKEAELESLRKSGQETKSPTDTKREPTDAEIQAALKKAREDGDVDFEVQILNYAIERKANQIADARVKAIEERNSSQTAKQKKQQEDWIALNNDYLVRDESGQVDTNHPLSLTNQKGILYTTALSLYQDKELRSELYNDPDTIQGFRRAVADAYREIMQQGLYKPVKKEVAVEIPQRKPTQQLAEPSTEGDEDTQTKPVTQMSDADKVREEIRARQNYRKKRSRSDLI